MSGRTLRRVVWENVVAVAMHSPFLFIRRSGIQLKYLAESTRNRSIWKPSPTPASLNATHFWPWRLWFSSFLSSSTGSTFPSSSFSLMTLEEMEFQKQTSSSDPSSSFTPPVVLFTRPTASLPRGIGGAMANCILGGLLSPIIFLSLLLEKVFASKSFVDVLRGACFAFWWASVFCLAAFCAAVQQLTQAVWYGCCRRPLHYLLNPTIGNRHCSGVKGRNGGALLIALHSTTTTTATRLFGAPFLWCGVSCSFQSPTPVGHTHALLERYVTSERIWEWAADRRARSDKLASQRRAQRSSSPSSSKSSSDERGVKDEETPNSPSYYALLGVSEQASSSEIKSAYRRLTLKVHPDHNTNEDASEQFQRLRNAYQVLSNPESRKKYDIGGEKYQEKLSAGKKNRDALRSLFGGKYCMQLVGDTFLNSFVCRVVDNVDFTEEELSVVKERSIEECATELLNRYLGGTETWIASFLSSYSANEKRKGIKNCSSSSNHTTNSTTTCCPLVFSKSASVTGLKEWEIAIEKLWRSADGPLNVGLGEEVLYLIGKEYERVLMYVTNDTAASSTTCASTSSFPLLSIISTAIDRCHRACTRNLVDYTANCVQRYKGVLVLAKRGLDSTHRQQLSVDAAWYWSSPIFEKVAWHTALTLLYDPSIASNTEERRRRVMGLWALSQLMQRVGKPYKPASRASINRLQESLFTLYSKKKA